MRHIPIKCPTCATTYRVGVGNDEDVSVEMDLRIRAQEELEQERTARLAAEERAEKAERENRELRGVVEAVKEWLRNTGHHECTCSPEYVAIGRTDPQCGYCDEYDDRQILDGILSTAPPYQCPDCADLKSRLAAIKSGALDRTGNDGMGNTWNYTDAQWLFDLLSGDFTCPRCEENDIELADQHDQLMGQMIELRAEKDKQIADYRIRLEQSIREGGKLMEQIAERDARLAEVKEWLGTNNSFTQLHEILSTTEPALAVVPNVPGALIRELFGIDDIDQNKDFTCVVLGVGK